MSMATRLTSVFIKLSVTDAGRDHFYKLSVSRYGVRGISHYQTAEVSIY